MEWKCQVCNKEVKKLAQSIQWSYTQKDQSGAKKCFQVGIYPQETKAIPNIHQKEDKRWKVLKKIWGDTKEIRKRYTVGTKMYP